MGFGQDEVWQNQGNPAFDESLMDSDGFGMMFVFRI
jgi:hypothetical protein